jgi:serine/threonine-protein kinase RsbW
MQQMHCYDKACNRNRAVAFSLALDEHARQIRVHTLPDLAPVFQVIENWMRLFGYSKKDLFAVRLSLEEAAANAFRHGNRNDPNKSVRVRYLVAPSEVLVEVQDDGCGFEVENVPDPLADENQDRPSGRGIFLMRAYSSWVSFHAKGNCVVFCKVRSRD